MRTIQPFRTAGHPRPPAKIERVLAALLEAPRTTRELEHGPIFDHVGHSTAADLKRLGVLLHAERVEILGFAGQPAWVARYSIPPEGRAIAVELLAKMKTRRGAAE